MIDFIAANKVFVIWRKWSHIVHRLWKSMFIRLHIHRSDQWLVTKGAQRNGQWKKTSLMAISCWQMPTKKKCYACVSDLELLFTIGKSHQIKWKWMRMNKMLNWIDRGRYENGFRDAPSTYMWINKNRINGKIMLSRAHSITQHRPIAFFFPLHAAHWRKSRSTKRTQSAIGSVFAKIATQLINLSSLHIRTRKHTHTPAAHRHCTNANTFAIEACVRFECGH